MYKVSSLVPDVKNIFVISTDARIFPRLFYLFIGAIKFVGEFRRVPQSPPYVIFLSPELV